MSGQASVEKLSDIFFQIAEAPLDRQQDLLNELCPDENFRQQVRQLLESDRSPDPLIDHTLFPPPFELKPGDMVSDYRLVRELALGGMGIVYLAQQLKPIQRNVALKVIKPGVDTREVIARFSAERQALSLMDHPNIAKVFDAGSTDTGRPFFVMELVNGEPFTEYCERRQLPIHQRLRLFVSVCQAIQHAHQKGIIHRDIKPSNVLVAEYDGQPIAKVIDFGVAKAINQSLSEVTLTTGIGQVIGTVDYMSPEQSNINHQDIDTRSDIYSLGVLLYELLTGTPPFDRQRLRSVDLNEMLRIIREEDPPKPSARVVELPDRAWPDSPTRIEDESETRSGSACEVPSKPNSDHQSKLKARRMMRSIRGDLDWIVMKAMEKNRDRRYATPIGLANDIERFLSGEAVSAGPPSAFYRFRKFAKRNRAALTTIGLLALAFVFGITGVAYQAVRVSRAEAKANIEAFEFITDSLLGSDRTQTSTGYSPDPNTKLMILLRNATDRVDKRFADEPALRARMKATLAGLLNNVGQYEDAARLYREYYEYLRITKGVADPQAIGVMRNLVSILINESRFNEAEKLGNEALGYSKQYLGEEHEITLQILDDLGSLYHHQKLDQKSAEMHQQVLETRLRLLGASHPNTVATMSHLGIVYESLERFGEAQTLHEAVLDAYQSNDWQNEAGLASALQNLGNGLLQSGRRTETREDFDRSAKLLQESLEIYKRNRGSEHTDTLQAKSLLAQAFIELAQLDDALPLLEDLLDGLEGLRDPNDLTILESMNRLGWTYMRQGRLAEAEYLLTNAYEKIRQLELADHLKLQVMGNLAIVRFRMGKIEESTLLDEQLLQQSIQLLGPENTETLSSKVRLGLAYWEQGRNAEAEALLQQVSTAKTQLPDIGRVLEILAELKNDSNTLGQ